MNRVHKTYPAFWCWTPLLLALCWAGRPPAASAQPYGLRSSDWTGAKSSTWFDARNWDNSGPDRYTAVTVCGGSPVIDEFAKAAKLTIGDGVLTIVPGGRLEITGETETPANTRRYDEWTYLTSHNAHTALEYNAVYAQQTSSLTTQLEYGVRGLMIDVHDWEGVDDEDLYLCHGPDPSFCAIPFLNPNNLGVGSAAAAISSILASLSTCPVTVPPCAVPLGILGVYTLADTLDRMKLEDGLDEIREFLEKDPDAIITIIIEDLAAPPDILDRFVSAGLDDYMYDPAVDHPDGLLHAWPSTDWMIMNNKRLVVFVQSSIADQPGKLLGQFAYTVENTYDIGVLEGNYDPTCESRKEDIPLCDRSRKLFVMNHFGELTIPSEFTIFSDFDSPFDGIDYDGSGSPNDYNRLLSRVEGECFTAAQRYPNFLTVDFMELPDDDPLEIVAELNSRWRPDPTTPGYNLPALGGRECTPIPLPRYPPCP